MSRLDVGLPASKLLVRLSEQLRVQPQIVFVDVPFPCQAFDAALHLRMQDTRLPKCVMFGELAGAAGCVGAQEKEWIRCILLDGLRACDIKDGQWTTAAQDEGEWRKTTNQGAGLSWRNRLLQRKSELDYSMW